jgi:tRNA uridine 5-carbamoylmethylation protein Kti12
MNFSAIFDEMTASEFEALNARFVNIGRNVRKCPFVVPLIGMPCAGKSTFTENYTKMTDRPFVIISSDNQIEAIAKEQGKTYSEVYPTIEMKTLESNMRASIRAAIKENKDIIIDRTNLTVPARRRWLAQIPAYYIKIGIHFQVENEVLFERLNRRARETGKKIPRYVIQDMLGSFTPPQEGEFDIIKII